ncbi:hypothetical protein QBC37DRAFT_388225 [Rhypophila decipiens]|uniref:NAD(P)-binding protein n=1 Tax=Rhypophila decipiens TaxID=261697 RepID=A0AAN6Y862_9PEZI|nr:hypothetical protein QBC37DRAFT_388225 [Rhypophila decipiens]
MAEHPKIPAQFAPRTHCDVYPFIHPTKFRGSLQDKVTIITGASGVIGKGLAESFAVASAKLVLTYNNTPPPPELKERCLKFGASDVLFIKCNVAQLEGCDDLVKQTIEIHGRVDILINNAGANGLGPMDAQSPQDFVYDTAVNLHGPYYLMRLVLPHFRTQSSGCVLNISSRAGTVAIPYSTSYCASKAALINLTSCVQKEMDVEGLGENIHLYSLHPGGIKSAMTLKKYSQTSVSVLPASAQPFFASALSSGLYDDSPYLNGMVCVALATGIAKDCLRGRYFDVGHDLEDVLAQRDHLIREKNTLYMLHTSFLGGVDNADLPPPGEERREGKDAFEFPGF